MILLINPSFPPFTKGRYSPLVKGDEGGCVAPLWQKGVMGDSRKKNDINYGKVPMD